MGDVLKQDSIGSLNQEIKDEQTRTRPEQVDLDEFQEEGTHLLKTMLMALVDDSASVNVIVNQGENTTVFEVKVAKPDVGKVIGRQGRTASAIRLVLNGFSVKSRRRSVVEIIE